MSLPTSDRPIPHTLRDILDAIPRVLHKGVFYTKEQMFKLVQTEVPGASALSIARVLEWATDLGILICPAGEHWLYQHPATCADLEEMADRMNLDVRRQHFNEHPHLQPEDMAKIINGLPDVVQQLQLLKDQINDLRETNPGISGYGHWVTLKFHRMPGHVAKSLRTQAIAIVGDQASQEDIEDQMALLAAKIISQNC